MSHRNLPKGDTLPREAFMWFCAKPPLRAMAGGSPNKLQAGCDPFPARPSLQESIAIISMEPAGSVAINQIN